MSIFEPDILTIYVQKIDKLIKSFWRDWHKQHTGTTQFVYISMMSKRKISSSGIAEAP